MCSSTLTDTDAAIIRALQDDFPLCEEPYKILAERAGVTQDAFLSRVQELIAENKIRKMGAVLRHREVGFIFNALCAWDVPPDRLDVVAEIFSAHPAVSHCYDRNTAPNWNYNLYTMIHARSRDECDQIIADLARRAGIQNRQVLYSKKEWKKTGMRYF